MNQTADFPISYHKKENGGKHTALNYAYQFINTPLTFIVDSDDSLTVDALSCVNEIYKKYKNESDLCGSSYASIWRFYIVLSTVIGQTIFEII